MFTSFLAILALLVAYIVLPILFIVYLFQLGLFVVMLSENDFKKKSELIIFLIPFAPFFVWVYDEARKLK